MNVVSQSFPNALPSKAKAHPHVPEGFHMHLPTTDGREVILTRYTHPKPDQRLVLEQMKLELPDKRPQESTLRKPAANEPV